MPTRLYRVGGVPAQRSFQPGAGGTADTFSLRRHLGLDRLTFYSATNIAEDMTTPLHTRRERKRQDMAKRAHVDPATRSFPPTVTYQLPLKSKQRTNNVAAIVIITAITMLRTASLSLIQPTIDSRSHPCLNVDAAPFTPGAAEHRRILLPTERSTHFQPPPPPPLPAPHTTNRRKMSTLLPTPPRQPPPPTPAKIISTSTPPPPPPTSPTNPVTFTPKIGTLNVEGLTRSTDLDVLLQQMHTENYDALLVQETWRPGLQDFTLAHGKWRCIFQGPTDTPSIHSRIKGGVGIILNARLAALATEALPRTFGHQAISIEINLNINDTLVLGSTYLPSLSKTTTMETYRSAICNQERLMTAAGRNHLLIVGTDSNAHIGRPLTECLVVGAHGNECRTNDQGRALVDSLAAIGCTLLPTQHRQKTTLTTYSRGGHDTQLDFLIIRTRDLARHLDCQNTGINLGTQSPHSIVCTELQVISSIKPIPRPRRMFKPRPPDLTRIKTDFVLRQRMHSTIETAENPFSNPDKEREQQQRNFRTLYSEIAGMVPPIPRKKSKTWITPATVALLTARNQSQLAWRKLHQRTPLAPAAKELRRTYKARAASAKAALNADRHSAVDRLIDEMGTGSAQRAWSLAKALQVLGSNNRLKPKTPRYNDPDGNTAISAQRNLEVVTAHYKSTMTRPDMSAPGIIERIPSELAWAPTNADGELETFTPTEDLAVQLARSLKHGKSGGPDDQVAEILCVMADTPNGRAIIHGLFTSWWNDGDPTCPDFWLHARLAIVPKTNPPSLNLNKTRGITVGTLEIKLMGAFNTHWLERWLQTHDFENQSGFRSKRGRADALFVIRQIISLRREYNTASIVCLIDQVKAFPSAPTKVVFAALRKLGFPESLVRGIESLYANSTIELWVEGLSSSFHPTGGVREGGMDSPSVFKVLVIVALMVVEYPDTYCPPDMRTQFDGVVVGRRANPGCPHQQVEAAKLNPQIYADDQTAIFGAPHNRGALTVADAHAPEARARFNKMTDEQRMRTTLNQNYLVNDIVPEIPGPWMAHAGCRLEIILPELETSVLADAKLMALGLSDLKKLAAEHQVEPLGDKRCKQTWIAALQSLTTTSNTRTLDVTVTGWDNKDRTVTVQPYHSRPGDVQTTLHLDHPFNVNPKWKLRAGPWLTGSIICDQWTPDPSGCAHPPYRGKVLAWDASQVNKAKIEYFDYANDTTMQDLDDSTTHSHWRLLQTKHHLETKPHHGFKDMDQMRIGYHALYKANVEVGMEPHNAPIGSTAKSKSQAVLIPARGSKLDDYDRTPLIVPEYYNGKCTRPPGQVDIVDSAGCLGDTIGSDIDTEVMQTDARVSAANKMWYSLKSRGMLRSNLLSKQHQGSVYRACVLSVLLDSTENWFMLSATYKRLRNYHRKCIRQLNYVTKRDRITATQLTSNLGLPPFSDIVDTAFLRWTGNIVRMSSERLPRQMMFAWMVGTRPTGAPSKTVGQRLIEVLRRKMLTFPGRAAFGTLTDPTATWHIAAQDQATWRAMMEHTT